MELQYKKDIDMKYNYLDEWYQSLLSLLVSEDQSVNKSDRTGTGTKSLFGIQFRHNMSDGFPLLTTKKMAWKTMVVELLWFLRGETNIKFLLDYDCHIWDGDAYKNYSNNVQPWEPHLDMNQFIDRIKNNKEFCSKWGDLGPIYGKQWRSWGKLTEPTITYNLVILIRI
jgi:thymidylate synthase